MNANKSATPRAWAYYSSLELEPLFSWCKDQHRVDRLLCVTRMRREGRRRVVEPEVESRLASLFEGQIVATVLAGAWPGTKLFGHKAQVTVVRFDGETVRRALDAGPLLWDWTHASPAYLPEDLCLFRQGAELPAFFSVTHEGLSWVVSNRKPPFGEPNPIELSREELVVPSGEFFCEKRVLRSTSRPSAPRRS